MNHPLGRSYRLVMRGQAGLSCDQNGVALGAMELVSTRRDTDGALRCVVRSSDEIEYILQAAYGPQPDEIVVRLHRGLLRVATSVEANELGRAGIEAVMLGFPDLSPTAMAKLATIANLEKAGGAWENEPRVPAGRSDGGQWTTDGGASAAAVVPVTITPKPHDTSSADSPASQRAFPLDDGVYRPGVDDPVFILAGAEENESRRGSNGPPDEFTTLVSVFPGLENNPGLAVPLAPISSFLGIASSADAANLDGVILQYKSLISEIRAVKPDFADDELLPPGGIAGMSWQGRAALLNELRMQRAAIFYKIKGDPEPLQVETLRFLQNSVDRAYAAGVKMYSAGRLQPRLSREEAIGNFMDATVRFELKAKFNSYDLEYGPRSDISINNRDYDNSGNDSTYTVPDARIKNVSFDWTLTAKDISSRQIRGFFGADSQPAAVIIVRPSLLGRDSTYLIPRPAQLRPRN